MPRYNETRIETAKLDTFICGIYEQQRGKNVLPVASLFKESVEATIEQGPEEGTIFVKVQTKDELILLFLPAEQSDIDPVLHRQLDDLYFRFGAK